MTINKKRRYSYIKLDGCLGTALHQAVDRWNESLGCTLRTGGETDLVCENKILEYQKREARRDKYIKRKALSSTVQAVQAPIGTISSE